MRVFYAIFLWLGSGRLYFCWADKERKSDGLLIYTLEIVPEGSPMRLLNDPFGMRLKIMPDINGGLSLSNIFKV